MKIIVTGAHFTPAVAVIEELKKYPDVEIIYVGRKTTLEGDITISKESQVLPKLGVKFIPIITGRLQREFTIYTIPSILKIPIGIIQAFWIILFHRPNVTLSFGGYVAVPIVVISWLFSIPILIHEQTLEPGLANKISAFFASKIALSFDQNKELNEKTIIVGNPLRKEILTPVQKLPSTFIDFFKFSKKNKLPLVLIMGGNQGSHVINITVEQNLTELTKKIAVIHVTGDNKFDDFRRLSKLKNERYLVKRWIDKEIGAIISHVDFVVCRAGVNTLSELAFFGKPALVIPFQPLYFGEQMKNAHFFEGLGLVNILPQSKLTNDSFLQNVKNLMKNLIYFSKNAVNAKWVVFPQAAKRLALETILLVQN